MSEAKRYSFRKGMHNGKVVCENPHGAYVDYIAFADLAKRLESSESKRSALTQQNIELNQKLMELQGPDGIAKRLEAAQSAAKDADDALFWSIEALKELANSDDLGQEVMVPARAKMEKLIALRQALASLPVKG